MDGSLAGHRYALFIGDLYYHGRLDVPADSHEAALWYAKASDRGSALGALYSGALVHFDPTGVSDEVRAVEYYDRALALMQVAKDADTSTSASALALAAAWRVDADVAHHHLSTSVVMFASVLRYLLHNKGSIFVAPLGWI